MHYRTLTAVRAVGLLLAFVSLGCQANSSADEANILTTVVLVRHAEKELTGEDPGLTEVGNERAAALAHVAGEMGIDAIYTTQFTRTRATAVPLASALGLDLNIINAGSTYAADMAAIVRTQHVGEVVLIVSHSNTVPTMIGELGVSPIPVIEDDEYDDFYVVMIASDGQAHLLPLRYGRETP